jgi:hypothetical protein
MAHLLAMEASQNRLGLSAEDGGCDGAKLTTGRDRLSATQHRHQGGRCFGYRQPSNGEPIAEHLSRG